MTLVYKKPVKVYSLWLAFRQVIQAKKASDQEMYTGIGTNVVINGDIVFHDYDPNKVGNSIYVPSPTMDVSSFIYDTSSAFDNDSTFDFMSGSVTNYSRMGGLEGFGSVENLSLDEFY